MSARRVGKRRPRPIDDLFLDSSDSSRTSDATAARRCEAFETRVAASESTRRSEWSSPTENEPRPRESGRSGGGPTHGRETRRSRSECRRVVHRCFALYSRDARDVGGSLVGRTHERVRRRTTGRNSNTGQHSVDALTGHLNTDIDARVTSQPSFLGRKAGANTHASRAQETSRECIGGARCGPPRMRKGEEKHGKTNC